MNRTAEEREVLSAIETVRMVVPDYGRGRPLSSREIQKVASVLNVDVFRMPMKKAAMLSSAIDGTYYLAIRDDLRHEAVNFVILHECAHVLRGDVAEPTVMHFTGEYPEFEHACDTFAVLGVMDQLDLEQDEDWVRERILELVPFDNYAWEKWRVPALASRAIRMRKLVDEWLD